MVEVRPDQRLLMLELASRLVVLCLFANWSELLNMQTRSADLGHLQMLGAVDFAIRGR